MIRDEALLNNVEEAKRAIMTLLQQKFKDAQLPAGELVSQLIDSRFSDKSEPSPPVYLREDDIVTAMWALIDEGRIRLTSDRTLVLPRRARE